MLKDITIGQYFIGNSPIHKMDPRIKILLTIGYVVMLFISTNPIVLGFNACFILSMYLISKIKLRIILKSLKPVVPIILFTAILNMFFLDGYILVQWWVFKITLEGIYYSVMMASRIICLIAGTSLLTYTTTPIQLTDGIERLLSPFAKIGFPAHELAMMMTIALRFIPTLLDETSKIMNAQKARGADLETGSLMQRVKALIPILIPLFVSAFRRADDLALAMECRCYHGGKGRTRMKQLKIKLRDIIASFIVILAITGIVLVNIYLPINII